jgi:hypothetical protein
MDAGLRRWPPHGARAARALGVVLACALAALWLAGCHRTPAEQQVRVAIEGAVAAARANQPRGVLAAVADDFVGNDGELDRAGLRQFLAARALRQDQTGVLVGPIAFGRHGARIVATFNLVLTGGRAGDLLSSDSAVYRMTTAWRREHGKWVCYNAAWSDSGR